MKLNQPRAKQSAIDTGAAVVGAIAAHAGTQYLTGMADDATSPLAKVKTHIPTILLGAALAVQALDIVPANNDMVKSALLGASVVTGMAAVREYSGANDATKNTAGLAEMVNKYVPGYSAEPAVLAGLGYTEYSESPSLATSLLQAGNHQRMFLAATPVPANTGAELRNAFMA